MPPRPKISKKGRLPRKKGKKNQKQKQKQKQTEASSGQITKAQIEKMNQHFQKMINRRKAVLQRTKHNRNESWGDGDIAENIHYRNREKLHLIMQAANAASAPATAVAGTAIASPAVSRAASAVPSRQASRQISRAPSPQIHEIAFPAASPAPSRQASAIASAAASRQASAIASAQASRQISRAPSPPPPPPIDDVDDIPPPPPIDDVPDEPERPKRKRKVKRRPQTEESKRNRYFRALLSKTPCKESKSGGFAWYELKDKEKGILYHYRYVRRTGKWFVWLRSIDHTSLIPLKRKPRVIKGLYKTRGRKKSNLKVPRRPKGQQTLFQAWGQK